MPNIFSVDRLIIKGRSPSWGKVGVIITLFSAISYLILPSNYLSKLASILFILSFFAAIIIIQNSTSGIEITCIQNNPQNSVRNQHNRRYQISHGIGHLETYFDIPKWSKEFMISLEINGPIEIIPWDNKPDSVNYQDNKLVCHQDINGFPVTLKLAGDPNELAEGEYNLKFENERTGREIHSVEIIGDPEPPEEVDIDEIGAEEAQEWGIKASTLPDNVS